MHTIFDFRSDTVTKPTEAMLSAMLRAKVGDDVYGEDPTVNALEEKVSDILGMEASLFAPSGTMANQIAIHLQTRPGDHVIAEEQSHVYLYEVGAAAALSSVQFDLISFEENYSNEAIKKVFKPDSPYTSKSALLVVENTHNRGSGKVISASDMARLRVVAHQLGMKIHCDGARLWNAAVALRVPESKLVKDFDSVSVCFSKGLGAPVGSALCGSKEFIAQARKIRKRWGGGMRQAGFLASAAIYAMDHHRERIEEDHEHMKLFILAMREFVDAGHSRIHVDAPEVNTNIMYLITPPELGNAVYAAFRGAGIWVHQLGLGKFRFLTHLHMSRQDIQTAIPLVQKALIEVGL